MAADPTQNVALQNVLLARADARRFRFIQADAGKLQRGNHPQQGLFPFRGNEPPHYRLTWQADYRGQRLYGTDLVVPASLLALGTALSLGEAKAAFDLTDVRLGHLGANPNTLSPAREWFWFKPEVLQVDSSENQPETITMTSVSPANGSVNGGTSIVLRGSGFLRAAGVTFGGVYGTDFEVLSDKVISVTTPAFGIPGAVEVRVKSVYGTQYDGVLEGGFTYFIPAPTVLGVGYVTSVSPATSS